MIYRVLSAALLLFGMPAMAAPHPDVLAAHAVVGRWLAAQNQRQFEAYAGLYADEFEGIKRTATGKETRLKLADWKADRKKMFTTKNLTVEIYGEEYGREKSGAITAIFYQLFRSGAYADQGLKILQLKKAADGTMKIVHEEIAAVKPLDHGADASAGKSRVDAAFPKGFAPEIYADGGPCKNELCTARLLLKTPAGEKAVPLGQFTNNPEGEYTGDYRAALRVFSIVPFGGLKNAVLVVLENNLRDKPNEPLGRRAVLLTGAPEYQVWWSGDLLTFANGRQASYSALGQTVTQYVPGSGKGAPMTCRAALTGAADSGKPELIYGCGEGAPQIIPLGG
jgi:hypothetical protein